MTVSVTEKNNFHLYIRFQFQNHISHDTSMRALYLQVTNEERQSVGCGISVKMFAVSDSQARIVSHIDVTSKLTELAAVKFRYVLADIHRNLAKTHASGTTD